MRALLIGSAAAGTKEGGPVPAPGGSSTDEIPTADENIVSDNDDDGARVATSTLEVAAPANDNAPVDESAVEEAEAEASSEAVVEWEASNDSSPVEDLPATGTND